MVRSDAVVGRDEPVEEIEGLEESVVGGLAVQKTGDAETEEGDLLSDALDFEELGEDLGLLRREVAAVNGVLAGVLVTGLGAAAACASLRRGGKGGGGWERRWVGHRVELGDMHEAWGFLLDVTWRLVPGLEETHGCADVLQDTDDRGGKRVLAGLADTVLCPDRPGEDVDALGHGGQAGTVAHGIIDERPKQPDLLGEALHGEGFLKTGAGFRGEVPAVEAAPGILVAGRGEGQERARVETAYAVAGSCRVAALDSLWISGQAPIGLLRGTPPRLRD